VRNGPARPLWPAGSLLNLLLDFLTCLNDLSYWSDAHSANKGPVRILYKCLVPIYVFREMKLLFLKQNYNVLSPSSYTHISVRDLYIFIIGQPILLQGNVDRSWKYIICSQTLECGKSDWGPTICRKGIYNWDFPCSARKVDLRPSTKLTCLLVDLLDMYNEFHLN
jgi:hypothetical protein